MRESELTREQEEVIETLSLRHGRVHVGAGRFEGGAVEVTIPGGQSWRLGRSGVLHDMPFNHSIDWEAE